MQTTQMLTTTATSTTLRSEFEKLSFPLMDKLFNTAVAMTRNKTTAEDLVQETYLKAYRFFYRFRQGTNFDGWMFRILINNFINQYRYKQREPSRVDFETAINSEIKHEPNEQVMFNSGKDYSDIFDDTICRALDRLPPEYRIVVLLSDVNHLKYKEIAQVLGCPIGTVMSRLSRGRRRLARFLKTYAVQNGFVKENLN